MSIWIDIDLFKDVKKIIKNKWPEKHVQCNSTPRSWQTSRYIQVSTILRDMDIHYELYMGKIQFHFEGKFRNEEYKPFLQLLRENVPSIGYIQWRKRDGMQQGLCEINYDINTHEELEKYITEIINLFDPLIEKFAKENTDIFPTQKVKEHIPNLAYEIKKESGSIQPTTEIKNINSIPFDQLVIPPYQRPYKWNAKNINQLINDIITFKDKDQYRLGTLVLHNNEIVDGQQRIVSLCLLIKKMLECIENKPIKEKYKNIISKLDIFTKQINFENKYSLHNVVENIHSIEARKDSFDESLLDFVLQKCEFVTIKLNDISEAFQFFDSQNARGKDLEAHDLLKAYHLREITQMAEKDSINIDNWQRQKTDTLKDIFLTLYRAKKWSNAKGARYFTKNQITTFKGISLKDGKRFPFYEMEIIAHIFSDLYSNDPLRHIDKNKLEYPYNINGQIINGSRFFDMLDHYLNLFQKIQNLDTYTEAGKASEIITVINKYNGMNRTGDKYIRSLFDTLILYYVDKFGFEELDKVVPKFFIWAYTLRLVSTAVQLASVDNYAIEEDSMFRAIYDAQTPYDIINIRQNSISRVECTKCEEIKRVFTSLNKYHINE